MVQDTMTCRLLARILEECRAEIVAEWQSLLDRRLPPPPRKADTERRAPWPADEVMGLVIATLGATDPRAREEAREALLTRYRELGRRWAEEQGAEPAFAAYPPRLLQAVWRVVISLYAPTLNPDDLLQVVRALDSLAMDLGLARAYGYMSYKEEVLAAQQQALSSLTDELTHVEIRQRRAIALDLHDSLAQQLVSLFSGIQHCERLIDRDIEVARAELARLRQIAQETIRDARRMIRDLHFAGTAQDGGILELGEYVADLEADTGIRHVFLMTGTPVKLAPTREALVVRIIQEALINARKHASPGQIDVTVEHFGNALRVSVHDNGRGFDVEEARVRSRRRGRFGLIGMQERAQLLGAELTISSAPGQGTTVGLAVPRERHA